MKTNSEKYSFFKVYSYLKEVLYLYFKEFKYLKIYSVIASLFIISSYSVYLFLDNDTISLLAKEDHFFEWTGFFSLLFACFFCFAAFLKNKNIFFLLLFILFFFAAGEEISWAQRIFRFETPDSIKNLNVQKEFNFHNLGIFSQKDISGHSKIGLERLLEANFLFRIFTMFWGIILPLGVYHIKSIGKIAQKLKLPIPPIAIGIYFFLNWMIFWVLHRFLLSQEIGVQDASDEIFETVAEFIILLISFYFYSGRKLIIPGKDIKDFIGS